jgi:hypothetical protein
VRHEPNEIGQLTDIQLTVVISIGHFEFLLNEAQDLVLGYLTAGIAVGVLIGLFGHSECLAFDVHQLTQGRNDSRYTTG